MCTRASTPVQYSGQWLLQNKIHSLQTADPNQSPQTPKRKCVVAPQFISEENSVYSKTTVTCICSGTGYYSAVEPRSPLTPDRSHLYRNSPIDKVLLAVCGPTVGRRGASAYGRKRPPAVPKHIHDASVFVCLCACVCVCV